MRTGKNDEDASGQIMEPAADRSAARIAFATPLAAAAGAISIGGLALSAFYIWGISWSVAVTPAVLWPAACLGLWGISVWQIGPHTRRGRAGLKLAACTGVGLLIGWRLIILIGKWLGVGGHRDSRPALLLVLWYLVAVAGAYAGAGWARGWARRRTRS